MSQNISVESTTRSSPNPSINPVLQAALVSLDVQLEEELARYRRQRSGRPVTSLRGLGRHQTRKPIELISVERVSSPTQQPALGMSTAPPVMFPLAMVKPIPEGTPTQESDREQITQTGQLETASAAISEPTSGGVVPFPANATDNNLTAEESVTQSLNRPEESADGRGDLVTVAATQTPPQDYLESSEKLLRSLAEEEKSAPPRKRFTDKLLTPLGVGSILLLLLSSATLAYLITNRATIAALGFDLLFASKTPTTAQRSTETSVPQGAPANDSPVVNGPDLASDEFVDLNLNTLSHLEGNSKPSPSPSPAQVPSLPALPNTGAIGTAPSVVPNSALPRRSSDLSSVLLPPTPPPGVVPSTTAPQVAPLPTAASTQRANTASSASTKSKSKPSTTAAKPTVTKKPQASSSPEQVAASSTGKVDGYYYVLVNSTSESALEQARTIVADAYVENFPKGSRIQMGAFKTESEAKTLIEELKRQGISASIYHP